MKKNNRELTKKELEKRQKYRAELIEKLDKNELKISDAVKLIRKVLGLGQDDYAKKVGVSKLTIMNIENNRGNPTMKSVTCALAPMNLELSIVHRPK